MPSAIFLRPDMTKPDWRGERSLLAVEGKPGTSTEAVALPIV